MYAVEDETFQRARSILSSLAEELTSQEEAGSRRPVDLHQLVRQSASGELPVGSEAGYLADLAGQLQRLFSIEEMFPRKRRARDS
jgi:hypothetical protein